MGEKPSEAPSPGASSLGQATTTVTSTDLLGIWVLQLGTAHAMATALHHLMLLEGAIGA